MTRKCTSIAARLIVAHIKVRQETNGKEGPGVGGSQGGEPKGGGNGESSQGGPLGRAKGERLEEPQRGQPRGRAKRCHTSKNRQPAV